MNQQTLSNLATPAGRAAYQELWHDLIIHQRRAVVPALWQLWRMAAYGQEMRMTASDNAYRIGQRLGPRVGTRVFMEEVIVRHYFNNVQALVYFGAVILLVFLGLRFAGLMSETASLIGVAIEALMLLILFAVLFYAPEDEPIANGVAADAGAVDEEDDREVIRDVLREIEEIGTSYASLAMRLEQSARGQDDALRELSEKVSAIKGLNLLESHAERLETTNTLLAQLTSSIEAMNSRIDLLFGKEIEFHVRQELQKLVGRDVNNGEASPRAGVPGGEQP
ncbi:MAG TPA: hypothetical protein VNA88_12910 [Candidatus Kapabacteria bacterium]|jgi:hypothetical protein|nr:hypothetical protein [Candidatus Kapabacteria bacterium]